MTGPLLLAGSRFVTDWLSLCKVEPVSCAVVDGDGKLIELTEPVHHP